MAESVERDDLVDVQGNRRFPREQEGFRRALNIGEGETPCCSSIPSAFTVDLADFRGPVPGQAGAFRGRSVLAWETSPADEAADTVFTWIGGSQVRPSMRPAFPFVTAVLSIDGVPRIDFPLGSSEPFRITEGGFTLWFEPRRALALVEEPDRSFAPHGVSGFYRLQVPGECLTAGEPLQLSVELPPSSADCESFFYVSPRTDVLQVSLALHREEIARLQADLVQLTRSHEMLYAQVYPEFFPERVKGWRNLVYLSATRHLHPPCLTVMRNGEVVLTFREAATHLDVEGRMMLMRSRDHGHNWNEPRAIFALPRGDHRCAPIVELPDGDWVTLDYRAGGEYHADGVYSRGAIPDAPTLWGAWSVDYGESWSFTEEPLVSPKAANRYAEAERHLIRLPSGRLLVAANTVSRSDDPRLSVEIAVFASDDGGRHWACLSSLPLHPHIVGEPTMLQARDGRIVLLSRSVAANTVHAGMLVQYVSEDEGRTWSEGLPTAMSSLSTPAHLLRLRDGRFLCTHASRGYPASVYVTVSDDEGRSWRTGHTRIVANDIVSEDSTYPTTGQLEDGSLITVWYGSLFGKFYIRSLTYALGELNA